MSLEIENVSKFFGAQQALYEINLSIGSAEFVCLLGPSGCGKTTLLRCIAGLADIDQGRLLLDGQDLAPLSAQARGFGIVFQSYSLFPHMTIAQNVGYGLRIRKTPPTQLRERVAQLLEMVHMAGMGERYPSELSGGQQQRVAIARALAVNPKLLLLDEPLSALDARVRAGLRHEIREVQQRLAIPTLMVTHDQEEAMVMADTIVCMNAGRIEQVGSPQALYMRPQTRFVADFMGHSNLLDAALAQALLANDFARVAPLPAAAAAAGAHDLCVRPEHFTLQPDERAEAEIVHMAFLGGVQRIKVRWRTQHLLIDCASGHAWQVGQRVRIALASHAQCVWVPAADGLQEKGAV